ncbi:C2 domain-containing protein [Dioscorea alata]|uniref:C2 domain-containing protein n=1 Tax=Dioscorea alata TaxID=55571 RepID=A0ACB7U1J0_DIOAL|nr:C2 domain-containing protein [Dioscorea alata]
MGKILIEVCMISARGLPRSSSLWKRQWFAVAWIDPNNKFCSKIDSSGSSNPTWKTKFSITVDSMKTDPQQLSLTVEVYSRDPIFLREKLQGTATVMLKEFFTKFGKSTEPSRSGSEETGSYQLRKQKSGKPQGFVDIAVRVYEQSESGASYPGINEGISVAIEDGPVLAYPNKPQPFPDNHFNNSYPNGSYPHSHPQPPPSNYANPQDSNAGYHRPPPPPPPPPANTGFLPTLFPRANPLPESYVGMPASGSAGRGSGPGFGMGLGAGALAAGAVIFGDDFMSGSSYPLNLDGSSLTVSTDPLF